MLRNISIASRIAGGFLVVLLLLLIIVADGLYAFHSINSDVNRLVGQDLAFNQAVQNVRAEVGNLRRYEKDSFINLADAKKHAEYHEKWAKAMALVRQSVDAAEKANDDPAAVGKISQLRERLKGYEDGYAQVYAGVQAGSFATTSDANKALDKFKDQIRGTEDLTKELVSGIEGEVVQRQNDLIAQIAQSRVLMLALGTLALLLALAVAWLVTRSIRQPLQQICELTETLASERDLTVQLPSFGKNEIGRVGSSLNGLLQTIRHLIAESHDHSARLVGAADRLSSVNQDITEAAAMQSQAAAASAASIEELTVSINVMADNAAEVESHVRSTSQAAGNGSMQADQAKVQIERIADSIARTSSTMDALNQRSNEIGDIVRVIHDIADQTNLLALNAAIEAARAGELGRGFAVVADEVRKLAERTTSATNEITERIRAVQGDTTLAYSNMQEAANMISSGVDETRKVSLALGDIHRYSQEAVGKVAEMASAVKEQSIASQGIAMNVEQIAQMNDSTRQSVNEAASLASGLKQQSGELDHSISRFRV